MKRIKQSLLVTLLFLTYIPTFGGIGVNAGLTPAQDRWILRLQYRNLYMYNSLTSTTNQMAPLVVAYGITSNFTLITKGVYKNKTQFNSSKIVNGFDDIYILAKFKALRKNTPKYIFGIAPFIATNIPIGNKNLSERVWNPELGVSISMRPRFWVFDFNSSYTFYDFTDLNSKGLKNKLKCDLSIAHQITLNENSNFSILPVLETSYIAQTATQEKKDNLDFVQLFVSPGIQLIFNSVVFEALYQYPVYQHTQIDQMKIKYNFIIGTKIMF